ncbi:N-acetylneuraminate synthase [Flavobacterium sp.]|jgi:N,N'-diacetyllegionaminate synthase|uniref:N-acetylneuraminate synthase n=1 Tax=Flavobacterium sp. TaxID=239 RepID=UPI0037BEBCCC
MMKTIIIAEAGVNHNGNITLAKQLIDVAADAKVDYVKFQTFKADTIVSPLAKKATYQFLDNKEDDFQYSMLKKLELSEQDHLELIAYATKRGISFFSTAFDVEGINFLDKLGLEIFKIPSGELTNFRYLKEIAHKGKPVIMSTGMASLEEIKNALNVLERFGVKRSSITILHCNTEYPTPMEDVNLKAMLTIGNHFGVNVGYSDHTLGIEVPIAAVALGAKVIEKHFTLDRNLPGPDHKASLEPIELKKMVEAIRNIEKAISGDGKKNPSKSEFKNILIARKSIHLRGDLIKGHILTEADIIPLRPGDGISAMDWETVIGKKLITDKNAFEKLNWTDLQ